VAGPGSLAGGHRGAGLRAGAAAHDLPPRRGRPRPLARSGVGVPSHGPGRRRGPGAGRSGRGPPRENAGRRQGRHRCRRRPHGQPIHRLVLGRRRRPASCAGRRPDRMVRCEGGWRRSSPASGRGRSWARTS
jgi:hypothetical protein